MAPLMTSLVKSPLDRGPLPTFEDVAQVREVGHLLEHAEVEEARLGVERPRAPDVDALHPLARRAVEHVHVRLRVHQQTTVAQRHRLQMQIHILVI